MDDMHIDSAAFIQKPTDDDIYTLINLTRFQLVYDPQMNGNLLVYRFFLGVALFSSNCNCNHHVVCSSFGGYCCWKKSKQPPGR